MDLKVDFNVNLKGTSYHNVNYLCSKDVLTELFGEPISPDDSKTKYEWDFIIKDDDGNEYVACLYDYKNGDFKDNEIIKWHIGSKNSRVAFMLVDLINEKLIQDLKKTLKIVWSIQKNDLSLQCN